MKRWWLPALMIPAAVLLISGPLERTASAAFHDGGVAHCTGCHVTHDGQDGLLNGSDPSSTCLNCHAKSHRVLSGDGSAYTPGGDFFWLSRSYSDSMTGYSSPGYTHGHNVVALDYGLGPDSVLTAGPSDGTVQYSSSWLSCTSCHDPHGKIANNANPSAISGSGSYGGSGTSVTSLGNFRLLGGQGYDGGEQAAGISFVDAAPVARAYTPQSGQWPAEGDGRHVDYGAGMSEWCTNCHSGFTSAHTGSGHLSGNGVYLRATASTYDAYVATGNLTGSHATGYDHFVPFERGTTDTGLLDPLSTEGPSPTANVSCLTCHRAHASAFSDSGRWDFQVQKLIESPVLNTTEGVHAYYGEDITTRYNSDQGQLCEKCHAR